VIAVGITVLFGTYGIFLFSVLIVLSIFILFDVEVSLIILSYTVLI